MSREPIEARSGLEIFDLRLNRLAATLSELLDLSGIHYNDINRGNSDIVVIGWNSRRWNELPPEAAPKVGAARKALKELKDLGDHAAREATGRKRELDELFKRFSVIIEQPDTHVGAPRETIEQVRTLAGKLVNEYRSALRGLPSAHGTSERLLIPDTSALLDRPDLQDWKLDGQEWTVTLVPQVLSELDDRKRDPRTREAAQKVINQIDEMDRRGDVFEGVRLSGKLRLKEVAVSPDMDQTLSWLRRDVPDDVIIASTLELTWADLTSHVALTASDRNVRNKARMAALSTVKPGDL